MALYIVLAVIAAIILLLVTLRARLFLSFKDERLKVTLRILCFKIELFGEDEEKIKKSDFKIKKFRRRRDKVLKKYKVKGKSGGALKRLKNSVKKTPQKLLRNVKSIMEEIVRPFGKHIRIDRFIVRISVGGGDAARVALNYGYVISALQFLVTFLECKSSLIKTKHKKAEVDADFIGQKWGATVDIACSVGVIRAISFALGYFMRSLTKKKK